LANEIVPSNSAAAMNRYGLIMVLGATALIWLPFVALARERATRVMAETSCDSIPVGPARTDCYIGLSMINRQKVEISAGVAQQIKDSARYRQVTGQQRKTKTHAGKRKSAN
jgi:hypothetical protein